MLEIWGRRSAYNVQEVIQRAAVRCARHFGILDAHLSRQDHLAGGAFTMGDIPAATALYSYLKWG
jgi:glutathione S-transferase